MNNNDCKRLMAEYAAQTEKKLDCLTDNVAGSQVCEAMRYSLLGGGKRIRASLVLAAAALNNADGSDAVLAASAIEMVHCYSLIHDDLPVMDNDDMRRGKPSCHKKYGEMTALLAGDALLTLAFETLGEISNPVHAANCVKILARAAGHLGMVYGQELDCESEGKKPGEKELYRIHENKTGALIKAALLMGAEIADMKDAERLALGEYADNVGLVFQIVDDILDCVSTTEELGKPVGSDEKNEKTTYATLFGIEKAKKLAAEYTAKATEAVKNEFGSKSEFLCVLAEILSTRSK